MPNPELYFQSHPSIRYFSFDWARHFLANTSNTLKEFNFPNQLIEPQFMNDKRLIDYTKTLFSVFDESQNQNRNRM
jgi:hypothetical protein